MTGKTKSLSAYNSLRPSLTSRTKMHQSPLTILTTNHSTLPTTHHNADPDHQLSGLNFQLSLDTDDKFRSGY